MKEVELECSRVVGILSELIMSLDLASRVPMGQVQTGALAAALNENGYSEVSEELERLGGCEAGYRDLLRPHGGSRASSGGYNTAGVAAGGGGAGEEGVAGAGREVSRGMRALSLACRSDGGALAHFPPTPPGSSISEFMMCVGALSDALVRRLQTSKARAAHDAGELANRQRRIDEGEKELARITEALRKQRAAQRKELAALTEKEALLTKELDIQVTSAAEILGTLQAGMDSQVASVRGQAAEQDGGVKGELDKLQVDLRVARDAHGEVEAGLRKLVVRRRLEGETALREYDAVVGALKAKLEVARDTAAPRAALADYLQYFERVDRERSVVEAERVQAERDQLIGVTLRDMLRLHRIKTFILPFVHKQKKRIAE
jgi:hypothetical protein